MATGKDSDNYSVLAEHPEFGTASGESFTSISAAVARAAELIQDGYSVEILSGSSPAPR
jgi:hypothetical protein